MEIRLQKYLADAGVASRRRAEEIILSGRVTVNGVKADVLGTKVDSKRDDVRLDGEKIVLKEEYVYIMLNKPRGYVTTLKEQFGRPAVSDLIKDISERIVPVGRLDSDTSGLLIMTNDGELVYRLTHPGSGVDKVYLAKVFGRPSDTELAKLRQGVVLDGKRTLPARAEITESGEKYTTLKITIREGRNREIRRMCEAVNHPVATLKRIEEGGLSLGDLPSGTYRRLKPAEIKLLKSLVV